MLILAPIFFTPEEADFWTHTQVSKLLFDAVRVAKSCKAVDKTIICSDNSKVISEAERNGILCIEYDTPTNWHGPLPPGYAEVLAFQHSALKHNSVTSLILINYRFPFITTFFLQKCISRHYLKSTRTVASISVPSVHPCRLNSNWNLQNVGIDNDTIASRNSHAEKGECEDRVSYTITPSVDYAEINYEKTHLNCEKSCYFTLTKMEATQKLCNFATYKNVTSGDAQLTMHMSGGDMWTTPGDGNLSPTNLKTGKKIRGRQQYPIVYVPNTAVFVVQKDRAETIRDDLLVGNAEGVIMPTIDSTRIQNQLDYLKACLVKRTDRQ